MREIKFRAWDKVKKTMCDVHGIDFDKEQNRVCAVDTDITNNVEDWNFECELMQYTGLKDKNGVEIYEGDIIKDEKNTWHISYVDGFASYELFRKDDSIHREVGHRGGIELEVIGNIYENSELLDNK